jgi:hypothetical protein
MESRRRATSPLPSPALNIRPKRWYGRPPVVLLHANRPTDGISPSFSPSRPPSLLEAGHLTVDGRLWPLLMVKFGAQAGPSEFDAYLEARGAWLRRCEPQVHVLDVREVSLCQVCPSLRQRYIDWLRQHAPLLNRWLLGSAYLMRSPEGRVTASLIRHGAGLNTSFVVTPSLSQAAAWAAERLRDAGLTQAATRVRAEFSIPAS